MSVGKKTIRRQWINIKTDLKKSWDKINNDYPEIIDDENTDDYVFESLDYDEGFKRPNDKLKKLFREY